MFSTHEVLHCGPISAAKGQHLMSYIRALTELNSHSMYKQGSSKLDTLPIILNFVVRGTVFANGYLGTC